MSYIEANMVNISIDERIKVTLEDWLASGGGNESIPITLFGNTISTSIINSAISFIESRGGGSIYIPPTEKELQMKIIIRRGKNGDFKHIFECNNYRYPIGSETRPYTGEEWQVGDIIKNSDLENSDSKCVSWICTESGIPAVWIPNLGQELLYDSQNETLVFSMAKGTIGATNNDIITQNVINNLNKCIILTVKADSWSDTVPYTQKIYSASIFCTDNPIMSYSIDTNTSTVEQIQAVKEAFQCLDDGTTHDGYIELVCSESKPKIDFNIMLKGL